MIKIKQEYYTEIQQRNEELRKTAPIPKGQDDLRGKCFVNKHNGVAMLIVGHWVSDKGIVIWKSDAGDVFGGMEIAEHWDRISFHDYMNRGEEE
jgi:hypothetical protein